MILQLWDIIYLKGEEEKNRSYFKVINQQFIVILERLFDEEELDE